MAVYVNRSLNLKKISCIGFDLDYTLVHYNTREFENLAHQNTIRILTKHYGYPKDIQKLKFDPKRAIVGLVIDGKRGNLLKLNCFGKVKTAFHGLQEIYYKEVKDIYANVAIDPRDRDYTPLDTNFAISLGVLYCQLIEKVEQKNWNYSFEQIALDIISALDHAHQDGSIKTRILQDPQRYIVNNPQLPMLLENFIEYGKKLIIITNSDYKYTQSILDYAINPYLKKFKTWKEIFPIVITLADKPQFFEGYHRYLRLNDDTGWLENFNGKIEGGIYQGGCFTKLEADLGLKGEEILYLGDHIYGDIVAIKRICGWRTGLILPNLKDEIKAVRSGASLQHTITTLNSKKRKKEGLINELNLHQRLGKTVNTKDLSSAQEEIELLNSRISALLSEYRAHFNPYWGEVLRAGLEESRYAGQLYDYACVYMTSVVDFLENSPATFFRPHRRTLPHELVEENQLP